MAAKRAMAMLLICMVKDWSCRSLRYSSGERSGVDEIDTFEIGASWSCLIETLLDTSCDI
jgi:hypothetical protein